MAYLVRLCFPFSSKNMAETPIKMTNFSAELSSSAGKAPYFPFSLFLYSLPHYSKCKSCYPCSVWKKKHGTLLFPLVFLPVSLPNSFKTQGERSSFVFESRSTDLSLSHFKVNQVNTGAFLIFPWFFSPFFEN